MVKKILSLVMVLGILGGVLAGCGPKEEEGAAPAPAADAPAEGK